MQALSKGAHAPPVQLHTMDGGDFSLDYALNRGPAILVFFKISCPVCQFALPYWEKLYRGMSGKGVTLIGISQNSKKDTAFFSKQYGITFPIALDDPNGYEVSNAYGITTVPTIFYVAPDRTIEVSSVGWAKSEVEEIAQKVSAHLNLPPIQIIAPGENVPAFRGG